MVRETIRVDFDFVWAAVAAAAAASTTTGPAIDA